VASAIVCKVLIIERPCATVLEAEASATDELKPTIIIKPVGRLASAFAPREPKSSGLSTPLHSRPPHNIRTHLPPTFAVSRPLGS
jgi:hypothetical protein